MREDCVPRPALAHRLLLARMTADGDTRKPSLEPDHNRVRVAVFYATTITAGDVYVYLETQDPERPGSWLRSLAGIVSWRPEGGQLFISRAPLPEVNLYCTLDGYVGSGECTILLESWAEA